MAYLSKCPFCRLHASNLFGNFVYRKAFIGGPVHESLWDVKTLVLLYAVTQLTIAIAKKLIAIKSPVCFTPARDSQEGLLNAVHGGRARLIRYPFIFL